MISSVVLTSRFESTLPHIVTFCAQLKTTTSKDSDCRLLESIWRLGVVALAPRFKGSSMHKRTLSTTQTGGLPQTNVCQLW